MRRAAPPAGVRRGRPLVRRLAGAALAAAVAAACSAAGREPPATRPLPMRVGTTQPVSLERLVAWHNVLPATAVRVVGRLTLEGSRSGSWEVAILATRAGGLRVVARGADGFELASDGARVEGRDGAGPAAVAAVEELPRPERGRWAALDPRLLVEALLPPPLPAPERLAGGAVIEARQEELRLSRLRRAEDGAYRPVRRVVLDRDSRRLVRIERFDGEGRRTAVMRMQGEATAPWPYPAAVRIDAPSFQALLEIERVSAAGPLRPADFRLASGSSHRP